MSFWMERPRLGGHTNRWHCAVVVALLSLGVALISSDGTAAEKLGSMLYGFSAALVLVWKNE